ncbi:hypothetical protein [uncultured Bacteroides sp.]|uniref:hypothetical protein n=1 Tax=uncultured Bacteroides sp. TaxID=162156 RepID=UPI0026064CCC|nr:hypothetical protein [uncultured Bacteroides sp.]
MGTFDFFTSEIHNIISPLLDEQQDLSYINEGDMRHGCISIVEQFKEMGMFEEYADSGLEDRMRIATSFYNEVSKTMGIDTEFSFVPMPHSMQGGYDPSTNSIELNINSLENPDCSGLFNTILHESRHAFQHRSVLNPDSVSIDNKTIDIWRQNFENYISPWLDYEAYREQPVEADAFDFADNMVPENKEGQMLAQVEEEQEVKNNEQFLNNELVDQTIV